MSYVREPDRPFSEGIGKDEGVGGRVVVRELQRLKVRTSLGRLEVDLFRTEGTYRVESIWRRCFGAVSGRGRREGGRKDPRDKFLVDVR